MITEGSELLLLFPRIAPIVGSTVLPILGAVPDGAIVLFSGLGDRAKAKEQLSVGVGALAGSTIMLLTIPWFLTILAGGVVLDPETGSSVYDRKLAEELIASSHGKVKYGVEPERTAMTSGAKVILYTCVSYIVIQVSAFYFTAVDSREADIVSGESSYAIICLVFCLGSFAWYIYSQLKVASQVAALEGAVSGQEKGGTANVVTNLIDTTQAKAVEEGLISLQHLCLQELKRSAASAEADISGGIETPLLAQPQEKETSTTYDSIRSDTESAAQITQTSHFNNVVKELFEKYDSNGNGCIDLIEFYTLTKRLHLDTAQQREGEDKLHITHMNAVQVLFNSLDKDASGTIDFEEFKAFLVEQLQHTAEQGVADAKEDQLEHRKIALEAATLLFFGTTLVLLFSDPLVQVLSLIGDILHISSFYISFILSPLASNASELIAAYSYAKKKTKNTVTLSLSTLQGAAIMNNTFCLSIFLALIYFRQLEWNFSAETISILIVEVVMVVVSFQRVQTLKIGWFVLSLFPASLALVALLQSFGFQ